MKALSTYKIPMHIAAALATGRTELISLTKDPHLDAECQRELLRLLIDLIEDRRHQDDKLSAMKHVIQQSIQNIEGVAWKLFRMVDAFDKSATRDELEAAIKRTE